MKELNFDNVLRYLFPGIFIYFYVYFIRSLTDNSAVIEFLAKLPKNEQWLGVILLAFVGSIIYLVYKSLLYDRLIVIIQDKLRQKSDNYRTYFKKQFASEYILTSFEARLLWMRITETERYLEYRQSIAVREWASGIHLLYMSCILSFILNVCFSVIWFFYAIPLLLLFSAFYADKGYESVEVRFIYSLNVEDRQRLCDSAKRIISSTSKRRKQK